MKEMNNFADEGELARQKRKLLRYLLEEQEGISLPPDVEITRAECDAPRPLSFAQQRLWFLNQLDIGAPTYNIPSAVRITGRLAAGALERSVNEILRRHEVLRTCFDSIGGQPVQKIAPDLAVTLKALDLSCLSPGEREQEVFRQGNLDARTGFDLSQAPLMRVTLLHLGPDEHVLLLTIHHIVSDGWSMGILVRELSALYEAYSQAKTSPLPELPIQYSDYALWQRDWLQGEKLQSQLDYWRGQLGGKLPVLQLPTDRPRGAVYNYRGSCESQFLSKELNEGVKELTRRDGSTSFMILLAAFNALLNRYTQQQDILVGAPIANRNREEIEGLIGFFVNTLVMRADISGDPSFLELLARAKETALGAYAHQDLPFERLMEELHPVRDLSHTPLFQVMFVLQNTPTAEIEISGLKFTPVRITSGTAKCDLTLSIDEAGDGLQAVLEYSTDLFEAQTIRRMLGHFRVLLESALQNPSEKVSRLPLLTLAEQTRLLKRPDDSELDIPGRPLHQLFQEQAEQRPERVALSFEADHVSYRELNERANKLAHYLTGLGTGPESLIGVCAERSTEMIVCLLGILKSGAAYVPLDPMYPPERLQLILEDARVDLLVTQQPLEDRLSCDGITAICVDRDRALIELQSAENPVDRACPDNMAYVIYTSGSTGKPKGVPVPHRNVVRLFASTRPWFRFHERDVWSLFHSYAFDFSVWELWGALLHGGRLVVVPYWVSRSPEAFNELLNAERVTVLNQTPSAFRQLVQLEEPAEAHSRADQAASSRPAELREVIFGGEALELDSLKRWMERHGDQRPRLVNMYGITETTVHVTYRPIKAADLNRAAGSVIGGPIPDLQVYILDHQNQLAPECVPGEICVSGAGLAQGYLRHPELTASRFQPDPFSTTPGDRMYKSGDLARRIHDGDIEYLGRIDHQVKVRGFRIEPGEIEATLRLHPAVSESAVVQLKEESGETTLAAYVVAEPSGAVRAAGLRDFLKQRLPDYMLPAAYVILDRFPLTVNGKVDRNALPSPDRSNSERDKDFIAPRNPVEQSLAKVWAEVLGVENAGIDQNYFALGGDSIRSIQVRSKLRDRGLDFSLQQLFQYQTIRELAEHVTTLDSTPLKSNKRRPFTLINAADRLKLDDEIEDAYPLSQLQAGMVFHSEYSADYIVYITSFHLRVPFDAGTLAVALNQLARRHEMLRTSFDFSNYSEPLQLVRRTARIPLEIEDLRQLSAADQEVYISDWAAREARRKFDWTRPPLVRFHVHLRTGNSIQITMSEPFLDGWSVASLYTELFERYFALLDGHPVPLEPALESHYSDFVALEREALGSEECRAYWREALGDAAASRFPRWRQETRTSDEVLHLEVTIDLEISDRLKRVALSAGTSLKSPLLAAHMKVVGLLSGQPDVFTGMLINGRPEEQDGEQMIGAFLNTVPFRLDVKGGTWIDLVRRAFEAENQLLPFRRFPIQELQRLYGAEKLFDAAFNYTHFHVFDRLRSVAGVEVAGHSGSEQTYYPLTAQFHLENVSSSIKLALDYRSIELSAEQVEEIAGYYGRVLAAMASDPLGRIENGSFLSSEERNQLVVQPNETRAPYSNDRRISELFEAQSERYSDRIALVSEDKKLSYADLNRRANQLARYLRKQGVREEMLVGICMDRSIEMIVAVLAILKAGGAYLPLDPEYPKERLALMLEDSGATIVLSQQRLQERLFSGSFATFMLDSDWGHVACERNSNLPPFASPENLAYSIYTSGSTGKPKGVLISHRSVVNVIEASIKEFRITPESRLVQLASLSFDASVLEIFTALLGGAALYLVSRDIVASGPDLSDVLKANSITTVAIPPSLLDLIPPGGYPDLNTIIVGGEACGADTAARWSTGRELLNAYAPTEATIYATLNRCAKGEREAPPLGKPISNMRVYLLDGVMHPTPTGVSGELFVGGAGIARGYLNRPGQTAERFVPDPFGGQPGERLYKTGDLARYRRDVNIEFVGRVDHQVKIRGFRIELGEIEAALSSHPGVREAVVAANSEGRSKRLVAYVVAVGGANLAAGEIKKYLTVKLPEYMVPTAIVLMDELPLTSSGKVDRNRLPEPERLRPELKASYVKPRTEIEERLTEIWANLLELDRIGVNDNFFELGGHSLLATQAVSQIRREFRIELPLKALFETPSIAEVAAEVETQIQTRRALDGLTIARADRNRSIPLSFAQRRLWFLHQFDPGSSLYNIPVQVKIEGDLDASALERSLREIITRHEILRTTFAIVDGEAVQIVNDARDWTLKVIDLQMHPAGEGKPEEIASLEAREAFDLEGGPLIRATLLKLREHDHSLLITMHHIISDGWSMGILVRELGHLYECYTEGKTSLLKELPVQYADFAIWQREQIEGEVLDTQLDYWKSRLAGSPPALEFPTDRPRPPIQTHNGAVEPIRLTRRLTEALKELGHAQNATLFMTLLAGFNVLLCRYTNQEDILVGTPIANRNHAEIEGLVGFFVNTLVLRTDLSGEPRFKKLLARVRDGALAAYANQDLPFERVVEELQPIRDMSRAPLFQVMFDLQNTALKALELKGLRLTPIDTDSRTAKFDLTLTMSETPDGVAGSLEYNTDLFCAATIERVLRHFTMVLEGVTTNPDEKISRLSLLNGDEKRNLLGVDQNLGPVNYGEASTVVCLFDRHADHKPDSLAVTCEGSSLTYRVLNERAKRLAAYLYSLRLAPDSVVGLCAERSVEMIVGLMAILKSGAAYLPLDPAYPRDRLKLILKDAGVEVLLTQRQLREPSEWYSAKTVYLDGDLTGIDNDDSDAAHLPDPESTAYVIYTSGSTGSPKGVLVPHSSLLSSTLARTSYYTGQVEAFLLLSSISFDSSVVGIFWTLCQGGMLVIPEESSHQDPDRLVEMVWQYRISHLLCLPSLYDMILRSARVIDMASLQVAIVAGEVCPADLVTHHNAALPETALFNEYGPTEGTVWSTVFDCRGHKDSESVSIGRPIPRARVYLLDRRFEPVPIGITGEIFVGGTGIACGYLNRPGQTAERFVPEPFGGQPGTRLYRTGDLARYRANTDIEFAGRTDHQVKIRGFRIELGEIEATLSSFPGVGEAVVVATGEGRNRRLVGYAVAAKGAEVATVKMRRFLKDRLPDYMVPTAIVLMEELPLTPNGKIDRLLLPEPEKRRPEDIPYETPCNPLQQVMAQIWEEVLGIEQVGVKDNFFELGGHSLMATQVVSRVREILGVELALRRIFEEPTVEGLALALILEGGTTVERTAEILLKVSEISDDAVEGLLGEQAAGSD